MISFNFKYKWIDFTHSVQKTSLDTLGYGIFIENETHQTTLTTNTFERANYHGWYTSDTLAGLRVFSFSWRVAGKTAANRETWRRQLFSTIQPEGDLGKFDRGFYDLEFTDGLSNVKTVKCKVFNAPNVKHEKCNISGTFEFDLIAETETISGKTTKTATGWIGYLWGFTLGTPLPIPLSWYVGKITCVNSGDWVSPVRVSVVWACTNPKIINITNWNKIRIGTNTSNLIYDNRNLDNDPTKRIVLTDSGTNILQYRDSGGGILLESGTNELVVLADSYAPGTVVTVTRRDGRIY